MASIIDKVRRLTRRASHRTLADLLRRLNPVIRGWCAYFQHGVSKRTFSYLDHFAFWRVVGWLKKRHPGLGMRTLVRGVTKSHSRPHCSNDNPFSEAQFKTLKYRPDFPDQFGSLEDARTFCAAFYRWYNHAHRHSGIGMHTPFDVHHGHAATVRHARAQTLDAAYQANPERFVRKHPEPPALPGTTWINRPEQLNSTISSTT